MLEDVGWQSCDLGQKPADGGPAGLRNRQVEDALLGETGIVPCSMWFGGLSGSATSAGASATSCRSVTRTSQCSGDAVYATRPGRLSGKAPARAVRERVQITFRSSKGNGYFRNNTTAGVEEPSARKSERSLLLVAGSGRRARASSAASSNGSATTCPSRRCPRTPRTHAASPSPVGGRLPHAPARKGRRAGLRCAACGVGPHGRRFARRRRPRRARPCSEQFRASDHVLIKDPRLSWFLPLWKRCAEDAGVTPCFATVLRHPAAVVESKQRSYGGWQGDVNRTAGWLNLTLFTERATREGLESSFGTRTSWTT